MNVTVRSEPYFLGGTQRIVTTEHGVKLSIIPQPSGMSIRPGLFEIAVIEGANIEVLAAYVSEAEVRRITGRFLLELSEPKVPATS